jgi:hypothetical protein
MNGQGSLTKGRQSQGWPALRSAATCRSSKPGLAPGGPRCAVTAGRRGIPVRRQEQRPAGGLREVSEAIGMEQSRRSDARLAGTGGVRIAGRDTQGRQAQQGRMVCDHLVRTGCSGRPGNHPQPVPHGRLSNTRHAATKKRGPYPASRDRSQGDSPASRGKGIDCYPVRRGYSVPHSHIHYPVRRGVAREAIWCSGFCVRPASCGRNGAGTGCRTGHLSRFDVPFLFRFAAGAPPVVGGSKSLRSTKWKPISQPLFCVDRFPPFFWGVPTSMH